MTNAHPTAALTRDERKALAQIADRMTLEIGDTGGTYGDDVTKMLHHAGLLLRASRATMCAQTGTIDSDLGRALGDDITAAIEAAELDISFMADGLAKAESDVRSYTETGSTDPQSLSVAENDLRFYRTELSAAEGRAADMRALRERVACFTLPTAAAA